MAPTFSRRSARLLSGLVALAGIVPAVSAQYYGGGTGVGIVNSYFLPQGAQVSGYSGLIFGVFAPLAIVTIILYIGLDRVIDKPRQAKALAFLVALFIIPSGGYKVISNTLIGLFGFSIGTPAPTVSIPLIGTVQQPDPRIMASILAFFISAYLLSQDWFADAGFQSWEYLASSAVAFLVWIALGGGIGAVTVLAWLALLFLAYDIFEAGLESTRREGFLVSLLGLFLFFHLLANLDMVPAELQSIAGTVAGLGVVVLIIFLLLTAGALYMMFQGYGTP